MRRVGGEPTGDRRKMRNFIIKVTNVEAENRQKYYFYWD
jgi:hypothetical protein